MSEVTTKGKVLTLVNLLEEQQVEIPIIQRDYAQGREDKKELRQNFLLALANAIKEKTAIKLDFIYGSTVNGSFQPLDGQQRLTTLFLLHWYASAKELEFDNSKKLLRFSYETRASSREFCQGLINNYIDFENINGNLSDEIIDSPWFFLSWKKDPTIDAMLRTLDDIHNTFGDIENLWEKLTNSGDIISFYYVELENLGLTDDLYIKMNARGKLLTTFENFKALFQKRINDNNWDQGKDFVETFACKIDTVWTDLFWNHRKNNKIDDSFIRLISTIGMIRQTVERSDDRISNISNLQRSPDDIRENIFSAEGYQYLYECLDIYTRIFENDTNITINFPYWQHKADSGIFSGLVYEGRINDASYTLKVIFFAQMEYLRKHLDDFNYEMYSDWMRVVRNIISRGDVMKTGKRPAIIRSPEAFDGVLNLISELSTGCNDIYNYLSQNIIKSAFAREQTDEEIRKAKLIQFNHENRQSIFDIEDTNFCQGRISFALDCIEYNDKVEEFDRELLGKVCTVFKNYLEEDISNDIRRGLLTIEGNTGGHNYYDYWWSYSHVVNADKRCLIENYRELEYFVYGNYKNRDYYKLFLKKLILKLTENTLEDIIQSFEAPDEMPVWQARLIKEPHLLNDRCPSHYIAIPADNRCCYLLKSKRPRDMDGLEKVE